jgi:hypothetical protein
MHAQTAEKHPASRLGHGSCLTSRVEQGAARPRLLAGGVRPLQQRRVRAHEGASRVCQAQPDGCSEAVGVAPELSQGRARAIVDLLIIEVFRACMFV